MHKPHVTTSNIGRGFLLAKKALVDYNEDGIVGASPVTAWTNSGTGGSAYDMDVVVGTGANLTKTTQLGHSVVNSAGSVGLETTAGQTITSPFTTFAVAAYDSGTVAAAQVLFDARATNRALIEILHTTDKFIIFQGSVVSLSEAADASPHIFTGQFNGDATSKLTVSDVGTITGNAGSNDPDWGSLFMRESGADTMEGYIARVLVFDSALTEPEISDVQAYLRTLYAL